MGPKELVSTGIITMTISKFIDIHGKKDTNSLKNLRLLAAELEMDHHYLIKIRTYSRLSEGIVLFHKQYSFFEFTAKTEHPTTKHIHKMD